MHSAMQKICFWNQVICYTVGTNGLYFTNLGEECFWPKFIKHDLEGFKLNPMRIGTETLNTLVHPGNKWQTNILGLLNQSIKNWELHCLIKLMDFPIYNTQSIDELKLFSQQGKWFSKYSQDHNYLGCNIVSDTICSNEKVRRRDEEFH